MSKYVRSFCLRSAVLLIALVTLLSASCLSSQAALPTEKNKTEDPAYAMDAFTKANPDYKKLLDRQKGNWTKSDSIKSGKAKEGGQESAAPQNQREEQKETKSKEYWQNGTEKSQGIPKWQHRKGGGTMEATYSSKDKKGSAKAGTGIQAAQQDFLAAQMEGYKENATDKLAAQAISSHLKNLDASAPGSNASGEQTKGSQNKGSKGGSQGEDAGKNFEYGMEMLHDEYLINVANENAATPTSSRAAIKTYAQAIWMVQQMYKQCFIPMAILLLLPGAIITNAKTLVTFGFLSVKDEDTANPFAGIMRAAIAIFLIPATQLLVSYVIDTANALEYAVSKEVSLPLIFMWAGEQIQTFAPEKQQGGMIKNLKQMETAPFRGKWGSLPVDGGIMEQMSGPDITMTQVVNELSSLLTEGVCIISAFQVVFMCYLFVIGPIAAAFFAWPAGVGRDLFRKTFATWVDGVVILALWKFWWNVVLVCMTIRLQMGVDIYNEMEVYMFIAFMAMLLFVPFNPFEFKAGEIVTHLLEKGQQTAGKVASGKGGAAGGGGGAGGGAAMPKGAPAG
jgi:hypothetical protein